MNKLSSDHLTSHSHRIVILINFLLIIVVALRRKYDLAEGLSIGIALGLLALFAALFASESFVSSRIKFYPRVYFTLQLIIVQAFGLLQAYQDSWSLLYIALGFQVAARCSRKEALLWFSMFAVSLLITLSAEFGVVSGPGRAMAYVTIGALLISYDIQYAQHEDTLRDSQVLLDELKEAHKKLEEHAAQAEQLATIQQRNQMVRELYDSVGQKVFALQLATETTRLLLKKDPARASSQIKELYTQTQSTLMQMRHLINQWRPD